LAAGRFFGRAVVTEGVSGGKIGGVYAEFSGE